MLCKRCALSDRRTLRSELPATSSLCFGCFSDLELPLAHLRKRLQSPEVLNALVLRIFLPRGLDRLCSLLADQSYGYQSHPASRARSLAHPPRPHLPDRHRFTFHTSHPAALALRPALAAWLLAILAGSRRHRRRPSLRRLGARAPWHQLEPLRHHEAGPRVYHHRSLC